MPPAVPSALDASAPRSPHEVPCDGFFDDNGFPRASPGVLAAEGYGGSAGARRLEVTRARAGRLAESVGGITTCYQTALSSGAVEAFRQTLLKSGFCALGSRKPSPPDGLVFHLEAHLPGVACAISFPSDATWQPVREGDDSGPTMKRPYRDVFDAFARLEREITGRATPAASP